MIRQIDTVIVVESRDEAQALFDKLTTTGADVSLGLQRLKWSVFIRYEQNDAAHVGRAILAHD